MFVSCGICDEGYFTDQGNCTQCTLGEGCLECNGRNGQCATCDYENGFFLDRATGTCLKCNEDPILGQYCSKCKSAAKCDLDETPVVVVPVPAANSTVVVNTNTTIVTP